MTSAPILAVVAFWIPPGEEVWVLMNTVGTVETRPLRVSVKSCLYSPRLILWVTLLT